ncbi:MAG: hypothetical protein ACYTDX_10365, partial [Planctomycetota bacterium]
MRDVSPLTVEEAQAVDRAARRLHGELKNLLTALPASARKASHLARHLNVERTACQRLVHSVSRPYPGPAVLTTLPGPKALRRIAGAARRTDPTLEAGLLADVDQAIERAETTTRTVAGSLSALSRRLTVTRRSPRQPGDVASSNASARQHLFDDAALLTGRHSRLWTSAYAYLPHPENESRLHHVRVHGLLGHVATPAAVPLTFHNFTHESGSETPESAFRALESRDHGDPTPASILKAFS